MLQQPDFNDRMAAREIAALHAELEKANTAAQEETRKSEQRWQRKCEEYVEASVRVLELMNQTRSDKLLLDEFPYFVRTFIARMKVANVPCADLEMETEELLAKLKNRGGA